MRIADKNCRTPASGLDRESRMNPPPQLPWSAIEARIHCDPGGRGLASYRSGGSPLDAGQLAAAATHLAQNARAVGIVTGFCVDSAHPPAAETDGPPGALFLARVLQSLGIEVDLVSDAYGLPLLAAGCEACGLPRGRVHEFPAGDPADVDPWIDAALTAGPARRWTHLVSVERAGPSHTRGSLLAQPRTGPAPVERFERQVPSISRDVCHNMRGMPIDHLTAPVHRLFDAIAARQLPITTLGIGDGGNEIGMGCVPWETLCEAIGQGPGELTACRVATNYLLLAGVSNWGAYALALASAALRGRRDVVAAWTVADERRLIELLVRDAGAVDGVTGQRVATVDGLPLEAYLAPLADVLALV